MALVGVWQRAPLQALARLHMLAAADLSVVATEIFGKSGRAILDALIAGERRTGPRRAGPGPPMQEDPRASPRPWSGISTTTTASWPA
jgi:hypothetical protein